jgi:hypothetical protein
MVTIEVLTSYSHTLCLTDGRPQLDHAEGSWPLDNYSRHKMNRFDFLSERKNSEAHSTMSRIVIKFCVNID